MAIVLKRFLIIIISCLASFLSVQQSWATTAATDLEIEENQETFQELKKVLRIFNLGEIETHLATLDKSDPLSLGEANLILAYHNERLNLPKLAAEYFKKE